MLIDLGACTALPRDTVFASGAGPAHPSANGLEWDDRRCFIAGPSLAGEGGEE